jgi:probable F420-dependent oxidoreductase
LELGLIAGYAKNEYEAAELPFPSAGQRIDHLAHTVTELRRLLAPDTHRQQAAQLPIPPIMLAGQGDRLLRLATRHADIIGLVGITPRMQTDGNDSGQAALAKRIAFIRAAAGDRLAMVGLSLMIEAVLLTNGHEADLSIFHQFYPTLSDHAIRQLPGVLHGTEEEIAETLQYYREAHSLSYFTVNELNMVDFAKVINQLR